MSIFRKALGQFTSVTIQDLEKRLDGLLLDDEQILVGAGTFRDFIVFTSKRMIIVDVQGVTGSKKEFFNIPYSSIDWYKLETAGTFDLDCDLKIKVRGINEIFEWSLSNKADIRLIIKTISKYILK